MAGFIHLIVECFAVSRPVMNVFKVKLAGLVSPVVPAGRCDSHFSRDRSGIYQLLFQTAFHLDTTLFLHLTLKHQAKVKYNEEITAPRATAED